MLTYQIELGIQPLCDEALADIESKINLENVVGEFFSWATAGYVLGFPPTV